MNGVSFQDGLPRQEWEGVSLPTGGVRVRSAYPYVCGMCSKAILKFLVFFFNGTGI
jgi:hypothetical protein